MPVEPFGSTDSGAPVERVAIAGHGLIAWVLTWGAVLQDLRLDGVAHSLVLGYPDLDSYLASPAYCGAIVGRLANRVAEGKAVIAGQEVQLDRNEAGRHCLHGGTTGSGRRVWRCMDAGPDAVTLGLSLRDGEDGFPGNLEVRATYRIVEGPALDIEIVSESDAETLCGFAPHSYFNLDGSESVLDHRLEIDAARVLPVDAGLIPTGEAMAVAGTAFDFRTARSIGAAGVAYDHNVCLAKVRRPPQAVARLTGPDSGVTMVMSTGEPGLQVYSAGSFPSNGPLGLDGRRYGPGAGLALEPQVWPDAPNQAWADMARLAPGQRCVQQTRYAFPQVLL